jgi:lipoate-protein ligase A
MKNPPALSIGYFQRVEREVDREALKRRGLGFVRRMTGGRAVLHDRELTYSVVVWENHPLIPSSVSESYRVISQGLLEGYRLLGIHAEMAPPKQGAADVASAACFDSPSDYELVIAGKKAAGSAQIRQRGVLMQHGSILIDLDADLLFDVLRFPSERVKERMKSSFLEKAVAINRVRDKPATLDEVTEAFRKGFARGLGVQLVPGELTEDERRMAEELARTRYGSEEWNARR